MGINIDTQLFWTIITALLCYDLFFAVFNAFISRPSRKSIVEQYPGGVGPGGMIMRSQKSLQDEIVKHSDN
jgi:hypothetical protein